MRPVSKALTGLYNLYLISSYLINLINMATQTSSPTPAVTVTSKIQPEIYTSKWGNVTLLNRENYPTFASTCRTTLIVAGAWNLVQGTEAMPTDLTTENGKDWAVRRGRALQIMYNSTSEGIRDTLDTYISNQDTTGLWTHLATYNQANNTLFITKVMESFHNESYNPPTDSIDAFAARLIKAQKLLADTENDKISDNNLRLRLIMGLPNTPNWQTAKQFIINQYNTFENAVHYLQSVETTLNQPNIAEANMAKVNNQGRGFIRGRGRGRNRGRGRGRGRDYQDQDQRSDVGPISPDQCSWCLKEGHWKKGCREYQKARAKARADASKEKDNSLDVEDSRFASADGGYQNTAYAGFANACPPGLNNEN